MSHPIENKSVHHQKSSQIIQNREIFLFREICGRKMMPCVITNYVSFNPPNFIGKVNFVHVGRFRKNEQKLNPPYVHFKYNYIHIMYVTS